MLDAVISDGRKGSKMKKVDLNYYPGWKRKLISFTIDDGNLKLDRKFLSLVRPAGILGSFNLCSDRINESNIDEYRELYRGYEITNHAKYHPLAVPDGWNLKFKDEPFDKDNADTEFAYPAGRTNHFYIYKTKWLIATDDENYLKCVRDGKKELEDIFGIEIKDFVWPYGRQKNEYLYNTLKEEYRSIRGSVINNFELPSDRSNWGYYATYQNLLERAASFDALEDDGKIKAFVFGVHSHDFENASRWDALIDFCKKYGNRPEDFYYTTVGNMFDIEDAINSAVITDDGIENPSDIPLYATVDGVRVTLAPLSVYKFELDLSKYPGEYN